MHFIQSTFISRKEEFNVAEQERNIDLSSKESEVSSSSIVDNNEDTKEEQSDNDLVEAKVVVGERPLDCSVTPPTSSVAPNNNNNNIAGLEGVQETVAKVFDEWTSLELIHLF